MSISASHHFTLGKLNQHGAVECPISGRVHPSSSRQGTTKRRPSEITSLVGADLGVAMVDLHHQPGPIRGCAAETIR